MSLREDGFGEHRVPADENPALGSRLFRSAACGFDLGLFLGAHKGTDWWEALKV